MIPILVTTEYRGVFFGYVESRDDAKGDSFTLRDARNCLYWSEDVRGFLGLAATGPSDRCRVGPKVRSLDIRKVTAVAEVNREAVRRWEAAPWKS